MRGFVLEGDAATRADTLPAIRAALAASKTIWIDLETRTPDADALLAETLKVHALAIEDVWADCEAPKIADYDEHIHVIVHSVRSLDGPGNLELVELDVILGEHFVVTHTTDVKVVESVREELGRSARLLKKGPAWVAHALIDRLVDDYLPMLDRFDEEVTALERDVIDFAGTKRGPKVMQRIFTLKRGIMSLRRNTVHQREILLRLSRAEFDEIPADAIPFFRDVYDHFVRVTDLADGHRELLTSTLEAFLSVQSNRMNEIMKTLTLISTVMLPLTFVAGVYGMNFETMPELKWHLGYPFALGLMATIALGIVFFFRRKKWL